MLSSRARCLGGHTRCLTNAMLDLRAAEVDSYFSTLTVELDAGAEACSVSTCCLCCHCIAHMYRFWTLVREPCG